MNFKKIGVAIGAAVLAVSMGVGSASATHADLTDSIVATVQGTATTAPTHGILYVYDNVTAQHHTRYIEYFQNDGYSKSENLVSSLRPQGVVLKGRKSVTLARRILMTLRLTQMVAIQTRNVKDSYLTLQFRLS